MGYDHHHGAGGESRRGSTHHHWRQAIGALMVAALFGHGAVAQDLSADTGAELYKRFCASCHGLAGRGDGPVASALKVEVPDLTLLVRHAGLPFPAEQVRRIIDGRTIFTAHGVRRMPVWGIEFSNAAADTPTLIDRLVEYLRSIQRLTGFASE